MTASLFSRSRTARAASLLIAACVLCAQPGAPLYAQEGAKPAAGGKVTLDFANAEIEAVARTMATITGRNVVVDPRVKGTMTLTSTVPVTPAQAMQLFASQLRTQGFSLVENNGISLVLPEAEAKLQSSAVSAGPVRGATGQIVTQIFRLTHENANNLVPILRPLISPNNTINVNPGTNALVITDYAENLQRIARIIAALDISGATGVEIVHLKYGIASDLAPLVARLMESGGGSAIPTPVPGQPTVAVAAATSNEGGYKTTLVPEPRSNAIIIRAANPARLALAKTLIEQLDHRSCKAQYKEFILAAQYRRLHLAIEGQDGTRLRCMTRAQLHQRLVRRQHPLQQHFHSAAAGFGAMQASRQHPAVIHHQQITSAQQARQIGKVPVHESPVRAKLQQPAGRAFRQRLLGNQLGGQLEIEVGGIHAGRILMKSSPVSSTCRQTIV